MRDGPCLYIKLMHHRYAKSLNTLKTLAYSRCFFMSEMREKSIRKNRNFVRISIDITRTNVYNPDIANKNKRFGDVQGSRQPSKTSEHRIKKAVGEYNEKSSS